MGRQKLVRPHMRKMPHSRKMVRVRGYRRIKRVNIKKKRR